MSRDHEPISDIQHAPYELLADVDATDACRRIEELYQRDPDNFFGQRLHGLLHEVIHQAMQFGMNAVGSFPTFGVFDIANAYKDGVYDGISLEQLNQDGKEGDT